MTFRLSQQAAAAAIVADKSLAVAASEARVTPKAGRTHLSRLFNKTGVHHRAAGPGSLTPVDDDTGGQLG